MPDPATTERLLDAAWAEAQERGVASLTLAAVGARAGVSRQAVYLHFGNRAQLLVGMAARIDRTSGFRRRVRDARELPPVEGLVALIDAWFDYLPTILPVSLALEAAWLTGGDGADAYRDRMDDWHEGLRLAVVRIGDDAGLEPGWTVETAADWIWTTVHPTHVHHLVAERGWEFEAAHRRLRRTALDPIDVDSIVTS